MFCRVFQALSSINIGSSFDEFQCAQLQKKGLQHFFGFGTEFCDHIAIARELGLPYVYLGYWVPGSQKMGYKAKFSGLEVYFGGNWQKMRDPDSYSAETHPLSTDPIAEQVANIFLPDKRTIKG